MAGSTKASHAKRISLACAIVLIVLAGVFGWYVSDYYRADATALAATADENGAADDVTVCELEDGSIAFEASEPIAGLIFYPGGKVQPEAYAPLLTRFAQEGITSVLVKPPLNLAFFDIDAAEGISEQYPGISRWMLAGHSLGGVAASIYLADHPAEYEGIAFLASYPSADLSDYEGTVLLISGTEDGVLNRANYEKAKEDLPNSWQECVIEGGNHASFGNYGAQDGDEEASISRESQQGQTALMVASLAGVD